jgi:hypothetical protein
MFRHRAKSGFILVCTLASVVYFVKTKRAIRYGWAKKTAPIFMGSASVQRQLVCFGVVRILPIFFEVGSESGQAELI